MRHQTCIYNQMIATAGYIAQWLERLTADQQVPGSNPGVPSFCVICLHAREENGILISEELDMKL